MRNCSSCAHQNPDGVERCVHCGTLLDEQGPGDDAGLHAELRPLLREGRLIEAIRLYRERTGKGLAEAKAAVDALHAKTAGRPEDAAAPAMELEAEIIPLLKEGRKIEAIKLHRERTGAGLKESKEAVERLAEREGIHLPRSGCLSLLALLLLR